MLSLFFEDEYFIGYIYILKIYVFLTILQLALYSHSSDLLSFWYWECVSSFFSSIFISIINLKKSTLGFVDFSPKFAFHLIDFCFCLFCFLSFNFLRFIFLFIFQVWIWKLILEASKFFSVRCQIIGILDFEDYVDSSTIIRL